MPNKAAFTHNLNLVSLTLVFTFILFNILVDICRYLEIDIDIYRYRYMTYRNIGIFNYYIIINI